jgi:hypothetical protein
MFLKRAGRMPRLLVAMLLVATVLAGCIEVRVESEFDEDLSARHTFQMTMERQAYNQLQAMGGSGEDDPFGETEEARQAAEEQGLDFEEIDNDQHIGWRVSKRVEDSRDVGAALNEVFTESDPEAEQINGFSGTIERDGNTYRLNLVANSDQIFEGQEEETEDLGMDMGAILTFIYVVAMPGEITETNGTRLDDNRVQWEIPLTGTTTMTAVSETTGGGVGGSTTTWIIVALVALLVLGGALAAYLFTQRRRPQPALGAAPAASTTTEPTYAAAAGTSEPVITTPPASDISAPSADIGPDDETRQLPPRPAND